MDAATDGTPPILSNVSPLNWRPNRPPSGLKSKRLRYLLWPFALVHCLVRSLTDMGHPPTAVVSKEKGSHEGEYSVWGLGKTLPAMAPGRDVLIKIRTILRHGGAVAALVDRGISRPFHNIFRLIPSLGAQVVFATFALQPDKEILVEYFAPPDPSFSSDEAIAINLQALQAGIDRALTPSSVQNAAPKVPGQEN